MPPTTRSGSRTPGSRPRNRKQLVVETAGGMFNDHGYHATSMEGIAAAEGITAAALYRHFPNKYALFARCAQILADQLLEGLAEVPDTAGLEEVLRAATRVTLANRAVGGIYRWEARYLEPEDRTRLRAKVDTSIQRVADAVTAERGPEDPQLLARAALGAVGSITTHRTSVAGRWLEDLLVGAALRVARADLAAPLRGGLREQLPTPPAPLTRPDQILAAAIPLFTRDGFRKVTMDRIAEAVGLAHSALYRHYPAKVDILAAACLRAAGLLEEAVEQGLRHADDPREAIATLADTYVAYSFEHTDLTNVAAGEVMGLPDATRGPVVQAQRRHIDTWVEHLLAARTDLRPSHARVLVHAGLGVVLEAGRWLRWEDSPEHRGTVATLLVGALGLPPPPPG